MIKDAKMSIGQTLEQLDTPALTLDLDRMKQNIAEMAAHCADKHVRLRPHIKTHKTPEIAKLQLEAGAVGITVAKLSEAETMAQYGITDIFIANQIIGSAKMKRLMNLADQVDLTVLVDSEAGVAELVRATEQANTPLRICIEINISDPTGLGGRCGVPFANTQAMIKIVKLIAEAKMLTFSGILGFRGVPAFFQDKPVEKPAGESLFAQAGHEEGKRLVALANELKAHGIEVEQVIGGSTPTAKCVAEVPGITEVHPGEYVFSGGTHVRTGLTGIADCALSVMTTVISRPHKLRAVIDGGSKTFAGDLHPAIHPNLQLKGFGILSTVEGAYDDPQEIPGAVLNGLNEEHGVIHLEEDISSVFQIGNRLKIIPNHICPVVNLFDFMYVIEDGKVTDVWRIKARGNIT